MNEAVQLPYSPISPATIADLEKRFTYHAPLPGQPARYFSIRETARAMAQLLVASCPPSRELSLALTHLEETVMWANAAIARNETG